MIQRSINVNISADVVTGVLGHAITLSCPRLNNDGVTNGRQSYKEWFRGPLYDTEGMVAKVTIRGLRVEENSTADARMWISSRDGDLMIQNLMQEDAGLYTCRFTGSEAQTIQLNAVTGMFNWSVYRYKIGVNQKKETKEINDLVNWWFPSM